MVDRGAERHKQTCKAVVDGGNKDDVDEAQTQSEDEKDKPTEVVVDEENNTE